VVESLSERAGLEVNRDGVLGRFGRWVAALLLGAAFCCEPSAAQEPKAPPAAIARFGVPAEQMLLLPKHLYVSSGWITVQPDVKRLGLGNLFSPPMLANPARIVCTLDGRPVEVVDYTWYPSEFVLHGKPVGGLDVDARVVPLAGVPAVVWELDLRNRSTRSVSSELAFAPEGEVGYSQAWPWSSPGVRGKNTKRIAEPGRVVLRSKDGRAELAVAVAGDGAAASDGRLRLSVKLQPGERRTCSVVIVLGAPEKTQATLEKVLASPERFVADARRNWERRIEEIQAAAPVIETPHAGLAAFYRRALLTFLSCRWDSDTMVFRPWYATSGMDGGAVCCYVWDISYVSNLATLCDAAAVRRCLLAFARADLTKGYAINPLDGSPLGAMYSYNYYSLTRLARDYVAITGDRGVLSERVRGETFLDYLYRYALRAEDMTRPPELVDYGVNKNLLELKRTNDYEHYTPSPNGERILIYAQLGELFSWAGRKTPDDLAKRAAVLRERFVKDLWDAEHGWFRCLDQERRPRIAYSIQVFDLLRTGMLSPEQQRAVVSHLNEDEFLSAHGVHSLSKKDEGYDPGDADWGGPGAYAGDVPELVVDLLDAGFEKQGVDVLRRILWWGQFPYIPQAVLAADRDYRQNGRANVVAGLAGGQAILNGLLGIRVDGQLISFRPVRHPIVAGLKLSNLEIRGRRFSVEVDERGEFYTVRGAGRVERRPVGSTVVLPLSWDVGAGS
jgi:hypothetical protein